MGMNGGARPGAGRKPRAVKFEGPIAGAEKRIADRLPELIDNLFVLAGGVKVEEALPHGGVRTYTKPPDGKANEYLLNRIMGKPTEKLEVSGEGGGAIETTTPVLEQVAVDITQFRLEMTKRLLQLVGPVGARTTDLPDGPPHGS